MATETAVDVVMPQMGVSVSEGTITKWLKQEGEQVEADESLLEISTDKVDTEVPSPASGTLTQILVQEGETVEVGTKLAQIGGAPAGNGQAQPAPPEPATAPAAAEAEAASGAEGETPTAEQVEEARPAQQEPAPAQPAPAAPPAEPAPAGDGATDGKSFVSPVVARIASEHGVDPGEVQGTGRGGRVTKKDSLNFIEQGAPAAAPATQPTPPAHHTPAATPAQAPAPAAAEAPTPAAPAPQPVVAEAGEQMEPMTAMRRGIAEHMRRSLDTSAHVTSAIEVDMSKVVSIRKKLKKEYEAAYGVNPTYLSFVSRATVETLREYPWINGEIRGEQIVTRNYVNLGFAVELA